MTFQIIKQLVLFVGGVFGLPSPPLAFFIGNRKKIPVVKYINQGPKKKRKGDLGGFFLIQQNKGKPLMNTKWSSFLYPTMGINTIVTSSNQDIASYVAHSQELLTGIFPMNCLIPY